MFYYRCKYVLDFYIVLFLSMLSQAVVFNKIFNLLYKELCFVFFIHVFSPNNPFDFIVRTKIIIQGDYKQETTISSPQACPDSCRVIWLRLRAG